MATEWIGFHSSVDSLFVLFLILQVNQKIEQQQQQRLPSLPEHHHRPERHESLGIKYMCSIVRKADHRTLIAAGEY